MKSPSPPSYFLICGSAWPGQQNQHVMPFSHTVSRFPPLLWFTAAHPAVAADESRKRHITVCTRLFHRHPQTGMQIPKCKCLRLVSLFRFCVRTWICISARSPSALPPLSFCFDSIPVKQQPQEAEEPEHLQHVLLLLPQLQCGTASPQH